MENMILVACLGCSSPAL